MRGYAGVILCLACVMAGPAGAAPKAHAVARLAGLDGKPLGTADFSAVNRGVLIVLDLHDSGPRRLAASPRQVWDRPGATP